MNVLTVTSVYCTCHSMECVTAYRAIRNSAAFFNSE